MHDTLKIPSKRREPDSLDFKQQGKFEFLIVSLAVTLSCMTCEADIDLARESIKRNLGNDDSQLDIDMQHYLLNTINEIEKRGAHYIYSETDREELEL